MNKKIFENELKSLVRSAALKVLKRSSNVNSVNEYVSFSDQIKREVLNDDSLQGLTQEDFERQVTRILMKGDQLDGIFSSIWGGIRAGAGAITSSMSKFGTGASSVIKSGTSFVSGIVDSVTKDLSSLLDKESKKAIAGASSYFTNKLSNKVLGLIGMTSSNGVVSKITENRNQQGLINNDKAITADIKQNVEQSFTQAVGPYKLQTLPGNVQSYMILKEALERPDLIELATQLLMESLKNQDVSITSDQAKNLMYKRIRLEIQSLQNKFDTLPKKPLVSQGKQVITIAGKKIIIPDLSGNLTPILIGVGGLITILFIITLQKKK